MGAAERGYNTLYIGGTDEYGTATEVKAVQEKLTPEQICNKYYALHKEIYEWFDISFDKFGRTSTPTHTQGCQSVFKKLWENNWLSEDVVQQPYCQECQRFLADRYVEGICPAPECNYGSARGDQCDPCQKAKGPEVSDTVFNWEDLQAKLNNELLKNWENFVNRVLSYIVKDPGYGSVIPDAENAELHPLTRALAGKVGKSVVEYKDVMEKVKLKQGLKIAMSISTLGNGYLQDTKFWKFYKEDRAACSTVMKTSAGLVYLLASLLEPFMPSVSAEIRKQLNLPPEKSFSLSDGDIKRAARPWEILPAGHRIGTPVPLFKRLEDHEVVALRKRFAGS
ncbi:OLC1v1026729C1 [Oldenlandia corymbosa var. corymbosa]|uniref:methionine--tRNA ligase n=1 Tax=Oldenlandia corymbosa var. corymbosa TaxID=529605 RepID=A0AAV1C903_OLDCO|nr:OLC1v1026729C1 [Oldenlandia corymbosa var. corymbosa]